MPSERFTYVWKYTIEPGRRQEFLEAYRPGGEWAQLFARDPSYIETKLLQDSRDENRFMTIDIWTSRAERDSFRKRYAAEFDDLDRRCEAFTLEESFVGDYVEIDGITG